MLRSIGEGFSVAFPPRLDGHGGGMMLPRTFQFAIT